jgi:hypothetical protein
MRMRDFGRRGADARVDAGGTRAGHGGSAAPSMMGGREDRGWRGHGGNAGVDGGQPRQNRAPTIMWTSMLCFYRVVKIFRSAYVKLISSIFRNWTPIRRIVRAHPFRRRPHFTVHRTFHSSVKSCHGLFPLVANRTFQFQAEPPRRHGGLHHSSPYICKKEDGVREGTT